MNTSELAAQEPDSVDEIAGTCELVILNLQVRPKHSLSEFAFVIGLDVKSKAILIILHANVHLIDQIPHLDDGQQRGQRGHHFGQRVHMDVITIYQQYLFVLVDP